MTAPPALPAGVAAGMIAYLLLIAIERIAELRLSRAHAHRLRARGAIEHGAGHFPVLVALHACVPLLLLGEVGWLGARPGPAWPAWLGLFVAAQLLRWWAVRTLGERWNVRVWVVPFEAPIRRGPYRFLRHPNYVAVALELIAGPMMFGAWRTAAIATAWNALAMALRIPAEERALRSS